MKGLAKDLNVPVLLLSQLNRALESRPNPHKRPKLADLRDSGNIEQDADVVLFLYRPEVYGDTCPWPPGSAQTPFEGQFEVNIAKDRNGPIGTTLMRFEIETGRFFEVATDY
jgi:replicative DNA helicase